MPKMRGSKESLLLNIDLESRCRGIIRRGRLRPSRIWRFRISDSIEQLFARKGSGVEAELSFVGNLPLEDRFCLLGALRPEEAGCAGRDAAMILIGGDVPEEHGLKIGAAQVIDAASHLAVHWVLNGAHVAQELSVRLAPIDRRTSEHTCALASRRAHRWIEEPSCVKRIAGQARTQFGGTPDRLHLPAPSFTLNPVAPVRAVDSPLVHRLPRPEVARPSYLVCSRPCPRRNSSNHRAKLLRTIRITQP